LPAPREARLADRCILAESSRAVFPRRAESKEDGNIDRFEYRDFILKGEEA
jgi:hypothetical protein